MTTHSSNQPSSDRADVFATTHWTVVLAAARKSDPQAQAALEELCRSYWFPLYAYIRHRGHSREDAEDLTQDFLSRFLNTGSLERLSSERGKFRAFLLASLKHFLANEWDKTRTLKRGGGAAHFSLDWHTADTQFNASATGANPEQSFDRDWALHLLENVVRKLQQEFDAQGNGVQFELLKPFLTLAKDELSYADASKSLSIPEGTVRVMTHRLRKRYRQMLRSEIAQTLDDPAMVNEEMKVLFSAFSP